MNTARYPAADPGDFDAMRRLGPLARLRCWARERRYRRRAPSADAIEVFPAAGALRERPAEALVLVCVVRNAMRYVASFLDHYRGLGVEHFAILDDRSDDGTNAFLAGQRDVELFSSNVRYAESFGGRIWRDRMFDLLGRDRWYVKVDADEFLIFPDCERRGLREFVADLEQVGAKRALAPMLDLYPAGPLAQGVFDPERHARPFEVSRLIDGDGYVAAAEKLGTAIRGGPRTRLFGNRIRLSKFPVIFVDRHTCENGASIHGPMPLARNYAAPSAVLLHYKFSSESVAEFRRFAEEGHHAGGATFYKEIAGHPAFNDELSLEYAGTIPYETSMDLVRRGFIEDLRGASGK